MIETIIYALVGCVVSAIFGYLMGKMKSLSKENKAQKNGLKMLLQSNLTNIFYVHSELGQIEDYKLKNWFNMLAVYEELGGNDYMHILAEKMPKLKVVRTDILR